MRSKYDPPCGVQKFKEDLSNQSYGERRSMFSYPREQKKFNIKGDGKEKK